MSPTGCSGTSGGRTVVKRNVAAKLRSSRLRLVILLDHRVQLFLHPSNHSLGHRSGARLWLRVFHCSYLRTTLEPAVFLRLPGEPKGRLAPLVPTNARTRETCAARLRSFTDAFRANAARSRRKPLRVADAWDRRKGTIPLAAEASFNPGQVGAVRLASLIHALEAARSVRVAPPTGGRKPCCARSSRNCPAPACRSCRKVLRRRWHRRTWRI